MGFHVFFIASLEFYRVNGAGFFQRFYAEPREKVLALLFSILQRFRPADFPAQIGIEDHGAHDDRIPEQTFVRLAGHLGHDAAAAGGLSGDRYFFRIPAESGNVPLHPFQACLLIQVAEVGRRVRLLAADLRMGQEAQRSDAVIDRNHNNTPSCNTLPVKFHFRRITALEAAAEKPHKHRQLFACFFCVRPYIQIQAVLAHGNLRIHMPLPAVNIICQSRNPLHGDRRKAAAVADAHPVFAGLRRAPAVPARWRGSKRNALKRRNPWVCRLNAPHPAIFSLDLP